MKLGGKLILLLLIARVAAAADSPWRVSVTPSEVLQGAVADLKIDATGLKRVKGHWNGRDVVFFSDSDGSLFALVGVDLEEKPGAKEVRVEIQDKAGKDWFENVTLNVKEKTFPQEKISVAEAFDRFDSATLKRIEREQTLMARLWAIATPRRLWRQSFVAPVAGDVTSAFGFRRIVNGSPRAPHGGVDLRAGMGTDVLAANDGRVVLRQDLFFSGKSLVLDHGAGLYTMYFHLEKFAAREGAMVRRGERIGWSGMSGRVTGPHLHWGARLNGARIDPFALLTLVEENQRAENAKP